MRFCDQMALQYHRDACKHLLLAINKIEGFAPPGDVIPHFLSTVTMIDGSKVWSWKGRPILAASKMMLCSGLQSARWVFVELEDYFK